MSTHPRLSPKSRALLTMASLMAASPVASTLMAAAPQDNPATGPASAAPAVAGSLGAVPADRGSLEARILPIKSGASAHDPTIIASEGWFYRFSTGLGVSVARSRDLLDWTALPPALPRLPSWTASAVPGATDLWAPEVIFRDGRYWMYYSVSTFGKNESAIGLATATTLDPDSPDHGWTDRGRVIQSTGMDDFNAIDANVVEDGQGGLWMALGSFWSGIKLVRLDPATGLLDPTDRQIRSIARRAEAPDAIEGAFILARQGWFYLFVSFDFCCKGRYSTYKLAVGRARTIEGPYLDRAGISLLNGGGTVIRDGDERHAGMGHNSILRRDGRELIVYHAYDLKYGGQARLRIEELVWDAEAWPLIPSQLLRVVP